MLDLCMSSSDTSQDRASVAVVTVSYRSEAVLPSFLESIGGASSSTPHIVVADNRQDGTAREIADRYGARYFPMPKNLGYGGAVNRAVNSLDGGVRWVLISNPDVVLGTDAVDLLLQTALSSDDIGAVGPTILTPQGDVYPSARAVPSLRNGIGHALFANLWTSNPWTRAYRSESQSAVRLRDAGWLSGACLLVRRELFANLGGFDPSYFMYFEDVDLGYRIGKSGYRNVLDPRAVVTHSGAHSTSGDSAAMIRAHHESAKTFLNRKYSGPLLLPLRWVLGAALDLRSRQSTRTRR